MSGGLVGLAVTILVDPVRRFPRRQIAIDEIHPAGQEMSLEQGVTVVHAVIHDGDHRSAAMAYGVGTRNPVLDRSLFGRCTRRSVGDRSTITNLRRVDFGISEQKVRFHRHDVRVRSQLRQKFVVNFVLPSEERTEGQEFSPRPRPHVFAATVPGSAPSARTRTASCGSYSWSTVVDGVSSSARTVIARN